MGACQYHQRVLLVFLGPVFLLSCVFVAILHDRQSRLLRTLPVALIAIAFLATPSRLAAQTASPDQSPPVASQPNESSETTATPAEPAKAVVDRPVSWRLLSRNVI